MKRVAPVLMLVLLLTPNLFAAEDLTGKWVGTLTMTMDADPKSGPVTMVVKQTGTTYTGTMGSKDKEQGAATVKGSVETVKKDGKDITNVALALTPDGDDLAMHFVLTLVDGHLKGKGQHEFEGHKYTGVMDLTRSK